MRQTKYINNIKVFSYPNLNLSILQQIQPQDYPK